MEDVSMFDLRPGSSVGGYTLVNRLGGGAMGSVWRVRDDGGNQYAMKILRDSVNAYRENSEDDEQARARLRLKREALALQKIHHPGVCSIVDMELDASIAFIVTELIEGRNLREDVEENGPYIADDLERLSSKLIDAVKAVHEAGIIHRDIKPTNVMIAAHGPVLVDFGIAMGEGESHVTRTGLVMGTPGFIAPEIIEGEDSDEITDWWSVSAVLAFAATGKPVFGTKPLLAVLERAASGNADLTGLPPKTMAAFRKALQPVREQRCSPSELEQAISQDAMDPLSWPEVNRPFDKNSACNDVRRMWREPVSDTNHETERETERETIAINSNNQTATTTMPVNATAVIPKSTNPNYDNSGNDSTGNDSTAGNNAINQYSYLYRGRWAFCVCAIVCAAIACVSLLDAVGFSICVMWIGSAAGYNIASSFHRQQLNNGIVPRHDTAMRVASLPWHIIRGLLYTFPRVFVILIAGVIGSVVYPLCCGNNPELLAVNFGDLHILLPTYEPSVFSQTSFGYAIGFVVAWIVLAFIKSTTTFYLGLGALLCAGKSAKR
ncbi:serine/threonine-protein kinase [Gardnerella vaginalis]|uniref:serine/threonine-protein kinase n=1 Tax=Gardnerella vaginalis TaxID=2702 RepID=UPI0039F03597